MLGHRTLSVEDYLTILKRRWWIIVIPCIILPIVALAITFFVTPQYTSQTLVIIDQQKVPSDFVKPVVTEDLNSRLASMKEQIMSRASLEPIIKKYNLYDSTRMDMDARLVEARKNIGIDPIQSFTSSGTPGFKISFTAGDPQTAQQVCQEITSQFTGANVRLRGDAVRETTDFLREQADQQKAKLDEQDQKLAAFKRQYMGTLPEDTQTNMGVLSTLTSRMDAINGQLENLQQSKSMGESALATQLQAFNASGTSNPSRTPDAEERELESLQAQESDLSVHYTDEYPALKRVRSRIADLRKQMEREAAAPPPPVTTVAPTTPRIEPASIQELRTRLKLMDQAIAAKRNEQTQLDAQIRSYQGKIQSSPQIEEEEKELTRDYQTTLDAYNAIKQRLDQAQMATDLEQRQQGETFKLLDAANLPESPTSPKRPVYAFGGLFVGLVLGVGIIALLEYKDTALRSERDVWAFTQLPTLGVIVWTDEAEQGTTGESRLAGLFRRKPAKNQLVDASG